MIDVSHLFPCHTTWIGFRRTYMRDFIGLFAPHLTPARIDSASWLNTCLKHKQKRRPKAPFSNPRPGLRITWRSPAKTRGD